MCCECLFPVCDLSFPVFSDVVVCLDGQKRYLFCWAMGMQVFILLFFTAKSKVGVEWKQHGKSTQLGNRHNRWLNWNEGSLWEQYEEKRVKRRDKPLQALSGLTGWIWTWDSKYEEVQQLWRSWKSGCCKKRSWEIQWSLNESHVIEKTERNRVT